MTTYNSLIGRTDAQALIPEEVANEIIAALPTSSVARRTFRTVPMGRGQQRLPIVSVLPTAYWVDGSADTSRKQTTEVNWGNKFLDARELAVIIPVPEAVLDDSAFDIWGETRPLIVEALGAALDAACLFNTNNPWPQAATYQGGIVTQAVAAGNTVTEGTGVDFLDDLNLAFGKVEADGYDVTDVYARRKVRAHLRGLRATTREPILAASTNVQAPPDIFGANIDYVPNGPWVNNYEAIVGDRSMAILGVRQDITFKLFTEGVISDDSGVVVMNLMQQDAIAMRVVARFGFAVGAPPNLENTNDATRFPFAVVINAGS